MPMDQSPTQWSAHVGVPPALASLGLRCRGIGGQQGRPAWVTDRVLDHYGVVIVDRGRGRLVLDRGEYEVLPGSLFWLFPGAPHSYGPDEAGWSERWVLFDGSAARIYERFGLLNRDDPLIRLTEYARVLRFFSRIRAELPASTATAKIAMSVAVQELIVAAGRSVASTTNESDDAQLLAKIHDLATTHLGIGEFADELGVPVSELRRTVKTLTGLTPRRYVLTVRMEMAQSLLVDTREPILAVARRCGYEDASYFTRVFTNYTGTSPTAFRAQYSRLHQR